MPDEAAYVEVQVDTVGRTDSQHWVVRLRDPVGRQLNIVIGQCEAMAIAQRQMAGFEPQRPLTQDLALNLWRRLGAELLQLRIDDLFEGIYYSKLTVNRHGERIDIDCRPSDGIALALTGRVPIYVSDLVMRRGTGDDEAAAEPGTLDELLRDLTGQAEDDESEPEGFEHPGDDIFDEPESDDDESDEDDT